MSDVLWHVACQETTHHKTCRQDVLFMSCLSMMCRSDFFLIRFAFVPEGKRLCFMMYTIFWRCHLVVVKSYMLLWFLFPVENQKRKNVVSSVPLFSNQHALSIFCCLSGGEAGWARWSRRFSHQQRFPVPPARSLCVPKPGEIYNLSSVFWVYWASACERD